MVNLMPGVQRCPESPGQIRHAAIPEAGRESGSISNSACVWLQYNLFSVREYSVNIDTYFCHVCSSVLMQCSILCFKQVQ